MILDTRRNTYRLLTGRKSRVVASLEANRPVEDDDAVRALVADQILDYDGRAVLKADLTLPQRSALETPATETTGIGWIEILATATAIAIRLRTSRLDRLVSWARAGSAPPSRLAVGDLIGLAHAIDRGRLYVPLHRNCLRDALLFARILTRRGIACHLVFGVRLDPFGAHSWVQADDLVLTGTLAGARNLTPILVL